MADQQCSSDARPAYVLTCDCMFVFVFVRVRVRVCACACVHDTVQARLFQACQLVNVVFERQIMNVYLSPPSISIFPFLSFPFSLIPLLF